MKAFGIGAIALTVAIFGEAPAFASDAPSAPEASVRVLNGDSAQLKWFGKGDLISTSSLCIASTTGRFRLQVLVAGATITVMPKFTVHLTTTAGDDTTLSSTGGTVLSFDGRVIDTNAAPGCGGVPNAKIQIAFSEADLTASLAGQYLGRLQLSISPN